jgi:hypothetical protein
VCAITAGTRERETKRNFDRCRCAKIDERLFAYALVKRYWETECVERRETAAALQLHYHIIIPLSCPIESPLERGIFGARWAFLLSHWAIKASIVVGKAFKCQMLL